MSKKLDTTPQICWKFVARRGAHLAAEERGAAKRRGGGHGPRDII